MPRHQLRDRLVQEVSFEELEPLMSVNRNDLAEMLGIGVTSFKIFIHKTLCLPRWPAQVIKSRDIREKNLKMRLQEAMNRKDKLATVEILQDLNKLLEDRLKFRGNIDNIRVTVRRRREELAKVMERRHRQEQLAKSKKGNGNAEEPCGLAAVASGSVGAVSPAWITEALLEPCCLLSSLPHYAATSSFRSSSTLPPCCSP